MNSFLFNILKYDIINHNKCKPRIRKQEQHYTVKRELWDTSSCYINAPNAQLIKFVRVCGCSTNEHIIRDKSETAIRCGWPAPAKCEQLCCLMARHCQKILLQTITFLHE
jgi:hypothetical protein